MKKGFLINIEDATEDNDAYRKVLYTSTHSQLVIMSIEPGDEIGQEVHDLDQFIRIEDGNGVVEINGQLHEVEDDWGIIIPEGVTHNVINTGSKPLKLYTIYSPPEHKDGIVQLTKADEKDEHFDGVLSEQ